MLMHREMHGGKNEETIEEILKLFAKTRNNKEFIHMILESLSQKKNR